MEREGRGVRFAGFDGAREEVEREELHLGNTVVVNGVLRSGSRYAVVEGGLVWWV